MWDTCVRTEGADAGRWRTEAEVKGDLSQTVGGSVPDVALPRLAFWFESATGLCDGPVHLPSNVARTLVKDKQIPLQGDVLERGCGAGFSCVWCPPKCQVDFFQKAKMTSQPPETLLFIYDFQGIHGLFFLYYVREELFQGYKFGLRREASLIPLKMEKANGLQKLNATEVEGSAPTACLLGVDPHRTSAPDFSVQTWVAPAPGRTWAAARPPLPSLSAGLGVPAGL